MNIYFAHAIADYNSDYEEECIKTINIFYKNCTICNPKDIIIDNEMPENGKYTFFLNPIIDKCNMIFAAPVLNDKKPGRFTSGVTKEIIYALNNNKKVVALINDEIKEIDKKFFTERQLDFFS